MSYKALLDKPATLPAVATVFTHTVTLVNRRTEQETCLTVKTLSDRFAVVMREIQRLKVEKHLLGYEVSEIYTPDLPF